jgi:hypothetical protein
VDGGDAVAAVAAHTGCDVVDLTLQVVDGISKDFNGRGLTLPEFPTRPENPWMAGTLRMTTAAERKTWGCSARRT